MRLLFLFVFLTGISYSQITISELIKVAKMDTESFEIYAMDRGYKFDTAEDSQGTPVLVYFLNDYSHRLTRYLKHFNFGVREFGMEYQTNTTELNNIYKELNTLGFKMTEMEIKKHDADVVKKYKRGRELVTIFLKSDILFIGYHFRLSDGN